MNNELRRHVPDAGAEALALLDPDRGPIEAPIRSEIFGVARFEQHAHSLAQVHEAKAGASSTQVDASAIAHLPPPACPADCARRGQSPAVTARMGRVALTFLSMWANSVRRDACSELATAERAAERSSIRSGK